MSRPASLAFACFALCLLLLTLSVQKPGLPMQLDTIEPTQYLMATSLLRDGDLTCDANDLARLFSDFPFASGVELSLTSDDNWNTARYAEPLVYPLLSAPFAALAGANGVITLNALCFLLVIYLAWNRLRRWNSDGTALLYCLGFLVLSSAFAYLFRLQPQMVIMAAIALALSLAWQRDDTTAEPGKRSVLWRVAISGASFALAIAQEPTLALLALPLLIGLRRRPRDVATWIAGCAVALATVMLLSSTLAGHQGLGRASRSEALDVATFSVDNPLSIPWLEVSGSNTKSAHPSPQRTLGNMVEDAGFVLWGRRGGLLPYFPLVLPVLAVFLTASRRSQKQWVMLATVVLLGATQVFYEPAGRAHHIGQIGNPHAVAIYPLFLYLLRRVPRWMITASYALGALTLSTLLLTPFGAVVPFAPVQAHTRNVPFSWLPFEYPTLGEAPDFRQVAVYNIDLDGTSSARLWAPADQAKIVGDELWLLGGESVEAWLESRVEIPTAVFALRNLAPHNQISVNFAGAKTDRQFEDVPAPGISFQTQLDARHPSRTRHDSDGAIYYYRLQITSRTGEKPSWRGSVASSDYLGVAFAILGTREALELDLYSAEWQACTAPQAVRVNEEFLAMTSLRNTSRHRWPHLGAARVRLSYRWLDASGNAIQAAGLRTELAADVEPDQEISSWLNVRAPAEPGHYLLEVDPLRENVAWFSHRNKSAACQTEIEVIDS